MTKCKLIINRMSGNSKPIEQEQDWVNLIKGSYDSVDTIYIDPEHCIDMKEEITGYEALAVCGGDGTLNSAINAIKNTRLDLIYIPTGTLNDTAKSLCLAKKLSAENKRIRRVDMGSINDTMFAYVVAGGTFTPIGYRTKIKRKKRFKFFAYLLEVFKEYKIHHIKAKIEINGNTYADDYTLIMAINNTRCFGFGFNKLFSHNDGMGQLLLIKAPKGNGLLAKIQIFFPLFRVFFMKMKKEKNSKYIKFFSFKTFKLTLESPYVFT
ncbi:MAG TPA: diacylglycerol kinase family protein, partial [Clostridia bacterium]|nr:diacylglycerol kinase family protein [Clostridia bacterium]